MAIMHKLALFIETELGIYDPDGLRGKAVQCGGDECSVCSERLDVA